MFGWNEFWAYMQANPPVAAGVFTAVGALISTGGSTVINAWALIESKKVEFQKSSVEKIIDLRLEKYKLIEEILQELGDPMRGDCIPEGCYEILHHGIDAFTLWMQKFQNLHLISHWYSRVMRSNINLLWNLMYKLHQESEEIPRKQCDLFILRAGEAAHKEIEAAADAIKRELIDCHLNLHDLDRPSWVKKGWWFAVDRIEDYWHRRMEKLAVNRMQAIKADILKTRETSSNKLIEPSLPEEKTKSLDP
jgi:hypothetical protein